LALGLYVEVTLELTDGLSVTSEGCGAGLFDNERHLGVVVAREVLGHQDFSIHIDSQIPLARGLGSSAALAVAAAAAAGSPNPLAVATRVDGHPENAGASLRGGLVAAAIVDELPVVTTLALDPALRFVLVIPNEELPTARARGVLPEMVPFGDAVSNITHMGLLIAGLADHRQLLSSAMDDRLHQPYRGPLLPFVAPLMRGLRDAGALSSCWSGAGSTVLGVVTNETASEVVDAASSMLHELSVPGEVVVVDADHDGLVLS
jgi:homoserine kinase